MSKRKEIIQLHCPGRANSKINQLVKVVKLTVYHIVKIFKELGTSEDRPRSGRPRTARSKKMIKAVQERVRKNMKRSTRQITKDMNVNVTSMRRVIKIDLYLILKIKNITKRQYLTPVQKQKKRHLIKQNYFLDI